MYTQKVDPDQIYLNIAKEYAKFSKCQFTKVGAIAVNERGRIIATGVNGTVAGRENCCDQVFHNRDFHIEYSQEHEIHAEQNLILELAKTGMQFSEISIYITISPCKECFKLLMGLNDKDRIKVDKIVFAEKYHRITDLQLKTMEYQAKAGNTKFYQVQTL